MVYQIPLKRLFFSFLNWPLFTVIDHGIFFIDAEQKHFKNRLFHYFVNLLNSKRQPILKK